MMRADVFLVSFGFSKSRESARRSIEAGLVTIDGQLINKPSEKVDETIAHDVRCESTIPYVGRGGMKLEAALDAFNIDPTGKVCIDIGASTGGFTDCLIRRGALRVYAVDSGHGQLAEELLSNSKVISVEGMNARFLSREIIPQPADMIVMDVSFISQTLIIPRFDNLLTEEGIAVTLIKPQFECGREAVGKGGIVKKPEHRLSAIRRVFACARECGIYPKALIRSPIVGGDGNVEFLALFTRNVTESDEKLFANLNIY
jgi:23S rRNA (cytidine1920-2'-O)/16S rRNA (cytidine1409-2'-O)-methyltransferase